MEKTKMISHRFDGPINIYPIFDVHYGSYWCKVDKFREYLAVIMDDPNGYAVLGGDLINNNIRLPGLPIDDIVPPMEQIRDICDYLRPLVTKKKILASVRCNHEFRSVREAYIDSSMIIASRLEIEDLWRPSRAIIKIGIGSRKHGARVDPAKVWSIAVWHGAGGGKKPGSSMNNADDYTKGYSRLDVMFTGHTHRPMMEYAAQTVIDLPHEQFYDASCLVCVASSWLENGGYALDKGLPPVTTCMLQKAILMPEEKEDRGATAMSYSELL